jgi:hypothetical protein
MQVWTAGYEPHAGPCEHSSKPSGSVGGVRHLDHLNGTNCPLLHVSLHSCIVT